MSDRGVEKVASTKSTVIDLIRKYITRLNQNNISVQKVVLFGSYMKGTQREDSDIDIAVISSGFAGDRYSDRRMIVPFRRGIDSRIEPMPFTPEEFAAGGTLIDEIKKTGKEIVIAEGRRI
jgi:uncharacterized protein